MHSRSDVTKPLFLPAGVADPNKQRGYVARPTRGIEALDLSDGKREWFSNIKARPVMVHENLVAALTYVATKENALQLIVLDRNDSGKLLFKSEHIVFPGWVTAGIVPSEGFRFKVRTVDHNLLFEWEGRAAYRGGAPPPAHIEAESARTTTGAVLINLRTGKLSSTSVEAKTDVTLPAALRDATLFSYQLGASDIWETDPWEAEHLYAAITGDISDECQTLTLQRWVSRSGQILEPVNLVSGEAVVSYVTPDGLYILIHFEVPHGSKSQANKDWLIFSVLSGKQIASVPHEEGAREASVLDSRLYYLVQAPVLARSKGKEKLESNIKVLDIVTKKLLWRRLLSVQPTRMPPALRQ